jgi:hypothetical protein
MKTTSTLKTALVIFAATILGLSANANQVNPSPKAQVQEEAGFSATFNDIKADLKWTANTEGNVSHFVVERSTDGVNFQDAAIVFAFETGTNNLSYKFSEKLNNTEAVIYYRLCTIDNNGKYTYSSVQTVHAAL